MKYIRFRIAMVFVLSAMGCTAGIKVPSSVAVDAELQRLESAKWHPSSMASPEEHRALFADDFVSVEYGADVSGGVERKLDVKALMSGPQSAEFFKLLDETHFDLSEWHIVHIDSDGIIVSYHVSAPSYPWNAYATSVWAKRGNRWQTVFYQASTAK